MISMHEPPDGHRDSLRIEEVPWAEILNHPRQFRSIRDQKSPEEMTKLRTGIHRES
jgi:hypothetical protein